MKSIAISMLLVAGCYQAEPPGCPEVEPTHYACTVTQRQPSGGVYVADVAECDAPSPEFAAWEACAGLALDECQAVCQPLTDTDPDVFWAACAP